MNQKLAERVKHLRVSGPCIHSWRALAEVITDEFPEYTLSLGWTIEGAHGNQLYGMDLQRNACSFLEEEFEDWETEIQQALDEIYDRVEVKQAIEKFKNDN